MDEVELHALAGRQAHRPVGELGEAVEGEPLLGGELAARDGGAHHARVGERQLLRRPLAPDVAVVLLIDAVELEEHLAALGGEGFASRSASSAASSPRRWSLPA